MSQGLSKPFAALGGEEGPCLVQGVSKGFELIGQPEVGAQVPEQRHRQGAFTTEGGQPLLLPSFQVCPGDVVAVEAVVAGVHQQPLHRSMADPGGDASSSQIILAIVYVGIVGLLLDRLVAWVGRKVSRGAA